MLRSVRLLSVFVLLDERIELSSWHWLCVNKTPSMEVELTMVSVPETHSGTLLANYKRIWRGTVHTCRWLDSARNCSSTGQGRHEGERRYRGKEHHIDLWLEIVCDEIKVLWILNRNLKLWLWRLGTAILEGIQQPFIHNPELCKTGSPRPLHVIFLRQCHSIQPFYPTE